MILLLRALSRALGFVLLTVAAVASLVAAGFAAVPGDSGLPELGSLTMTSRAADEVGHFLSHLEAGHVPADAAVGAGVAAAVGLILLAGALLPRRERELQMDRGDDGRIVARRKPLQVAASTLAGRPGGVTRVKARVRGRYRRRGGRLRVRVGRGPGAQADALGGQVRDEVSGLAGAFALRPKVRTRRDEKQRRLG